MSEIQFLRRLVDIVWMEATEGQSVPYTDWADRMIETARSGAWCQTCKKHQLHHGDPDSIHLHLCNACNGVVEY